MENDLINTARQAMRYWWLSLLIGLLSLGLGIWCIFQPVDALLVLTLLFVTSFFVAGILEIVFAISNKDVLNGWGWTLANGIIDLILGGLLLAIPASTPFIMIYFVGFWIMFQSIWGIGMSCDLQRMKVNGWGWFLTLAILGLIFSFIFIMSPGFGGEFIVAFASVAFIFYGVFRIYLGVKLKSFKNRIDE